MAGTLKNIVALAAGFVEGLGLGPNTKAAIMRAGLGEMMRFARALYPAVREQTFLESCGIADLIATCYGGRNRLVARTFAERSIKGQRASFSELEVGCAFRFVHSLQPAGMGLTVSCGAFPQEELLKGQKLQGTLTSDEVQAILKQRGWELNYPLFTTGALACVKLCVCEGIHPLLTPAWHVTAVNRIVSGVLPPEAILTYRQSSQVAVETLDESSSDSNSHDP